MKLLLFHVDSFEYWTTRPTKLAEANPRENNRKENATVVFTAVEPGDTEKVNAAVDEIKKVQGWMHSAEVFIYPYAHLSENLSSKDEAIAVMNSLCEKLGCERAPFGWYKKFTLSVKGHPMSEFSRRI